MQASICRWETNSVDLGKVLASKIWARPHNICIIFASTQITVHIKFKATQSIHFLISCNTRFYCFLPGILRLYTTFVSSAVACCCCVAIDVPFCQPSERLETEKQHMSRGLFYDPPCVAVAPKTCSGRFQGGNFNNMFHHHSSDGRLETILVWSI